ncbi:MAG: PilZ domain-containing protein [Deltaproteobacteria bacterium]|nr:PilZ domain-containing protein [Deltaproteobacteria bacterium]MBW2416556.1 PilZ domain-containing protein [Deltaproteobacteria bacterium]
MSNSGGSERRKLKRFVRRIPAKFTTATVEGTGHVKNLSKQGLFMRTNCLPVAGEEVQIIILTRDRRKIEVVGLVRWTTAQLDDTTSAQPGFGVLIENRSAEFVEFFTDLLLN